MPSRHWMTGLQGALWSTARALAIVDSERRELNGKPQELGRQHRDPGAQATGQAGDRRFEPGWVHHKSALVIASHLSATGRRATSARDCREFESLRARSSLRRFLPFLCHKRWRLGDIAPRAGAALRRPSHTVSSGSWSHIGRITSYVGRALSLDPPRSCATARIGGVGGVVRCSVGLWAREGRPMFPRRRLRECFLTRSDRRCRRRSESWSLPTGSVSARRG
jgi:hypothetical protein